MSAHIAIAVCLVAVLVPIAWQSLMLQSQVTELRRERDDALDRLDETERDLARMTLRAAKAERRVLVPGDGSPLGDQLAEVHQIRRGDGA